MPPWLFGRAATARTETSHQTELAMVAARPGDRVLVIGTSDATLAAELARVVGLNGQLVVIDDAPDAAVRVERAAAHVGALVEFQKAAPTALPNDAASVDIVVMVRVLVAMNEGARQHAATEALRVLRPGGRLIVIEGGKTRGSLRLWRTSSPSLGADAVISALGSGGWKAARVVAEVDGVTYVEATKPRVP